MFYWIEITFLPIHAVRARAIATGCAKPYSIPVGPPESIQKKTSGIPRGMVIRINALICETESGFKKHPRDRAGGGFEDLAILDFASEDV